MKTIVVMVCALCVSLCAYSQDEADTLRYKIEADKISSKPLYPYTDMPEWSSPKADGGKLSAMPTISMTSFMNGLRRELPSHVYVILPNNTLEMWGRVNVSNGQAQNWGPYPNSYLDARTLSFPAPR